MQPVPSNIVRALEIEVPQFVNEVNRTPVDEVSLAWELLGDNPDLFYNCVWYAVSQGKHVFVKRPKG